MHRMKRIRVAAALAVVSALALAGCSSGATEDGADEGPIKIGLVTSLTGPFSTLGEGNLAGAQQAVQVINEAGGIDGRELELVYRDDKTEADQSVVGFNELASDSGIVAVLGSTDSTSASAVAPTADRAGLTYLALSPVTAIASGENKFAFIVPSTTANYAKKLVDYWVAEGYERVAIAYDAQDVFGQSGYESTVEYAEAAGVEIVFEEAFDPTASDYTAMLTKVRDSSADGLLVWNAGPAAVVITKQFAELGIESQLFMTGAQGSSLYLEPAGEAANGVILAAGIAVAGFELPEGPLRDTIDSVALPFQESEGYYPTEFFFNGASGVFLLAEAIRQAGSTDRAAIRDALQNLDYLAPTGRYQYSETDHGGLTDTAISILAVVDGQFSTTDYQIALFETELPE